MQLYGPVGRAPPLEGGAAGEEASAAAPLQRQLPPGAAQQMAACLATPFTGTDKNLGEILRSEVGRLNAEQELKTQLRWEPYHSHVSSSQHRAELRCW